MSALNEARLRLETVVNVALYDANNMHFTERLSDRIMDAADAYAQAAIQSHIRQEDTASGQRP